MRSAAPVVVQVFGDIRQLRKIREGAGHRYGLPVAEPAEDVFQLRASPSVPVATKPNRGLPDALDQIKNRLALLLAQRVSEQPSQQADIRLEREILVDCR